MTIEEASRWPGIKVNLTKWTGAEIMGYTPKTTFWQDFCIAEAWGTHAVENTFDRAFEEWKENYTYLTELVLVLNHKIWDWYEVNKTMAKVYDKLWRIADRYAVEHLEGEELRYFYNTTD